VSVVVVTCQKLLYQLNINCFAVPFGTCFSSRIGFLNGFELDFVPLLQSSLSLAVNNIQFVKKERALFTFNKAINIEPKLNNTF